MQFLTFIGFTALVAIISYYKTRNTEESSSDGYFLGGRSLTAKHLVAIVHLQPQNTTHPK
jgi:uncharacterized sodium:solute symporter family permease YidK